MSAPSQWADLAPRVISGVIMLIVGALAVYFGGWPFRGLIWAIGGLMMWELARMFDAEFPLGLGLIGALTLALSDLISGLTMTPLFIVPLIIAATFVAVGQVKSDRVRFGAYTAWILAGSLALMTLRLQDGIVWALWLILVVIMSDVAGYFAGRMLGGPKFWPAISPKKTWSGTIAGWLGAAVIGLIFMGPTGAGVMLIPLSMLTGFAGQMGDIAQSAIKRRKGVKDSSDLLPGHGGVFDRFDAMLGASTFVALLWITGWVPALS